MFLPNASLKVTRLPAWYQVSCSLHKCSVYRNVRTLTTFPFLSSHAFVVCTQRPKLEHPSDADQLACRCFR